MARLNPDEVIIATGALPTAPNIARDMESTHRRLLVQRLIDVGADVLTNARVIRVDRAVVYID